LGNTLYGTAYNGGSSGNGTVFKVNTDGTGFTNLHSFSRRDNLAYTNDDGAFPSTGLVSNGDTLFGTTLAGGTSAGGTLFSINSDGAGFTNLHSFTAHYNYYGNTNTDGFRVCTSFFPKKSLYIVNTFAHYAGDDERTKSLSQ